MTKRWAGVVVIALGCQAVPDAPRLLTDATATIDATDSRMLDAATIDRSNVDDRMDAAAPLDSDVFGDAPRPVDGGDADVIDVPTDTDATRSDVIGVPTDVDAGGVSVDVPRLVGGFISSAVVPSPGRLSGGFTWQGVVSGMRLEGWLR